MIHAHPRFVGAVLLLAIMGTQLLAAPPTLQRVSVWDKRVSVHWEDLPFHQVLRDLHAFSGCQFVLAPALKDREEETVTLNLSNVKLPALLRVVKSTMKVAYYQQSGVIFVTTKEDVVKKTATLCMYDVRAWLFVPTDFRPRPLGLRPSSHFDDDFEPEIQRAGISIDELVEIILNATGRDEWDYEGVSIQGFHGRIVVRHTPSMQRKVWQILAQL